MDKRITRYASLEAMKKAEQPAWRRLPPRERLRAVMDLTVELYALKGQPDVPRLQRSLVRIKRPLLAEKRSQDSQSNDVRKDRGAGTDDDRDS